MRRTNLTLIIRLLFFVGLVVTLALTAVRGEAGRRPANTRNLPSPASSGLVLAPPFRISPAGEVEKWVGSDWVALDGVPSRATALAVSDRATVYVGTEALGAYKSTDGGESWAAVNNADLGLVPGSVLNVTALAVDPADATRAFAATAYLFGTSQIHTAPGGIYASRDGGATWQALSSQPLPGVITDLELDATAGTLTVKWAPNGEWVLAVD
jgi:hypothetical protein